MKNVVVVGSGAGGAAVANRLKNNFKVTVLESGREFKPFSLPIPLLEKFKKTGVFLDEREIQCIFPSMKIMKTKENMVLVKGNCLGGTTTLSAGNALRQDAGLQALGIDLEEEFTQLYREIPVSMDHQDRWQESTKKLYDICAEMGMNPTLLPKLGDYSLCNSCGRCVLGCNKGAKWDSRQLLKSAEAEGVRILTGCQVTGLRMKDGAALGVETRNKFYPADIVVLAAGGFSTPVLLEKAGILCEPLLFVDPVLCVAAHAENSLQNKEISMPFAVQGKKYIIAPYYDYLSFFFNKKWIYPAADTLTLMVKLADCMVGSVEKGKVQKTLTRVDQQNLQEGVEACRRIFEAYGIRREDTFLGTMNAGHPGGMLPLTEKEAETLHNPKLPDNVYVADASLLPRSLGNPPILTIMALAMRVGKIIESRFS